MKKKKRLLSYLAIFVSFQHEDLFGVIDNRLSLIIKKKTEEKRRWE